MLPVFCQCFIQVGTTVVQGNPLSGRRRPFSIPARSVELTAVSPRLELNLMLESLNV